MGFMIFIQLGWLRERDIDRDSQNIDSKWDQDSNARQNSTLLKNSE